ncbi:Long-chain fatty acid transport protein [Fodinibius salinus]|uniref:Long-chain fatty acid transport protein n=1 Tax=Fodinibius salinus TaxID=860790 RepID=A0A5D3YKU2_9BACT|nr:type IX secretion system outer membrane channel protein PorV [Fodinibius salinus]TYP94765.1 Long-chain fatty acid transport protein [Fodinibius salinus]
MVKKVFATFILLLFSISGAYAQVGITSVPFLQIEPDSRAAGMGNTGVAIADNASAVFWNPAGLGFQRGNQISITHSEWLPQFNADLFYDYLVGKYHLENIGTIGGHITFLNLGEQVRTNETGNTINKFNSYELAVGLSYGFQINQNWSLGTGARFIYSSLAEGKSGGQKINPGSSVGIDIAGMYQSDTFNFLSRDASMKAGLNISNIGPKMKYTDNGQKDPLPTMMRLGWSFTTNLDEEGINTLTIANDISKIMARADTTGSSDGFLTPLFTSWDSYQRKTGNGPETLSLAEQLMIASGIEYWYNDLFALRSGFYYEDPNNGDRQFMTLGAGLRYKFFGIDFSYIYTIGDKNHPLANTTRFGLLLNF